MSASRSFGAFVGHDGVCLVEYQVERTGIRVIEEWTDQRLSTSVAEAIGRLVRLVSATGASNPQVALAIEQFGVFHHVMTLPGASDDVLRPVVRREVQRVFGIPDPVFAFTRGTSLEERRGPDRADERTVPRQLFVAGAPRETVDALRDGLVEQGIDVQIATVVPKAIHSLYEASGGTHEPTAVLVVLEGGSHLSFFLDGRLELAIDPPIALEGERPSVASILDQVERGAVYFRQQFRGAAASRLLLAARDSEYDALAAALEQRLGVQVKRLFSGANTPEAVVGMGAVLEARNNGPLDLYPHPPTLASRLATLVRGPNAFATAAAAVALIAGLWCASQYLALAALRGDAARLSASIRSEIPAIEPMRQIAERRGNFAKQVDFLHAARDERATLATSLGAIAQEAPPGIGFDSLQVARSAAGWIAALEGQAIGATAAQAARTLDSFFRSVRARQGVASPSLDHFDYPAPPASNDSTPKPTGPVVIQFRLSFSMARTAGASH
ncbi:MAG: hypothetical protein JWM41_2977 [Gemmatimonadetes bacterium]|nr:hypothetical protein [Gemmatimonadota bacterium]